MKKQFISPDQNQSSRMNILPNYTDEIISSTLENAQDVSMWGISTSESVCTHWQTPDDTAGLNRPLGILIKADITRANICVLNSPQCHNNIPSNQIKMIYEFTYSLIEHVNSHVWHANTPKTTSNAGKTMMHYPFL